MGEPTDRFQSCRSTSMCRCTSQSLDETDPDATSDVPKHGISTSFFEVGVLDCSLAFGMINFSLLNSKYLMLPPGGHEGELGPKI